MSHSTSFRFRAKPGERQAVIDTFKNWSEERGPKVDGFVQSFLTSNNDDPDEFIATAVFTSTETYNANSNDPDTSAWFQRLREHLAADPDWFNGTVELDVSA